MCSLLLYNILEGRLLYKQFKFLAQFKFSVLNVMYYMQRFNVKFALDFTAIYYVSLYIVRFCRNLELFIHTIERVPLFSNFLCNFHFCAKLFVLFSERSQEYSIVWISMCFVQMKVLKSLWRNNTKEGWEKTRREMEESSRILFEGTEHFDLLFKRACRYWPGMPLRGRDLHVPRSNVGRVRLIIFRKIFHKNDSITCGDVRPRTIMLSHFIRRDWTRLFMANFSLNSILILQKSTKHFFYTKNIKSIYSFLLYLLVKYLLKLFNI